MAHRLGTALLSLTCAAALFACGDSDDSSGGNGASSATGMAGSGAGPGSSGGSSTVFANYQCDGTAASGSCDDILCQLETGYNDLVTSCAGQGAPAGICDSLATCIADLASCFEPACASGQTPDVAALNCIAAYSGCAFLNAGTMP